MPSAAVAGLPGRRRPPRSSPHGQPGTNGAGRPYVYMYILVFVYMYMYMYMYTYMYMWMYMYMWIFIYIYTFTCIYVYAHIYVYMYLIICMYMYIYTHTHMYICEYTYMHMYGAATQVHSGTAWYSLPSEAGAHQPRSQPTLELMPWRSQRPKVGPSHTIPSSSQYVQDANFGAYIIEVGSILGF